MFAIPTLRRALRVFVCVTSMTAWTGVLAAQQFSVGVLGGVTATSDYNAGSVTYSPIFFGNPTINQTYTSTTTSRRG